mmetsp:Transcript_18149/g.48822  ORF Transcript_18149/g.48822 Transcript_18149/m.48822 type:complete len:357 (+) Transcript_18149:109-1179(+)
MRISLVSVLAAASVICVCHAEDTVTGILTDIYCWDRVTALDGANMQTEPEKHTVHCLRDIQVCIDGGYGILTKGDGDSTWSLAVTFDQAGNTKVAALLAETNANNNYVVTAKGEKDGKTLKVTSLIEGTGASADDTAVVAAADSVPLKRGEPLLFAHILCMCLSWGCLIPWGVTAARWGRDPENAPKGAWFVLHKRLQYAGWTLQLIGFACIVVHVELPGKPHFTGGHTFFGLATVIIGTLQPLNAVFRPHADPTEIKSPARRYWEYLHKGLGYIAVLLGVMAICFGIDLLDFYGYDMTTITVGIVLAVLGILPPAFTYLLGFVNKDIPGKVMLSCFMGCAISGEDSGEKVAQAAF